MFKPDPIQAPAIRGDGIREMIGTSGSACSLANTACDRVFSFDSPPSRWVGDDGAGVVIYTTVTVVA